MLIGMNIYQQWKHSYGNPTIKLSIKFSSDTKIGSRQYYQHGFYVKNSEKN